MRQNSGVKIVFYVGTEKHNQLKMSFFLGCHMIMSHGWSSDNVLDVLTPLVDGIDVESDVSVASYWRACFVAKRRKWINFKETFDLGLDDHDGIQMDEYLHYAR
jgi:hypothetical protein